MLVSELYRINMGNPDNMLQSLHIEYDGYIYQELRRIVEDASSDMSDRIIRDVKVRLSELELDEDVKTLVFDCLRKEVVDMCRMDASFCSRAKSPLVRTIATYRRTSKEALKLSVVLSLMSAKIQAYFLDRYYYFKDVAVNKQYEQQIADIFSGKGFARIRLQHHKLPIQAASIAEYVCCLNELDFSKIHKRSDGVLMPVSDESSSQTFLNDMAEREYRKSAATLKILGVIAIIMVIGFFVGYFLNY